MDKFQLAMLAQWAGEKGLQGRKRLQKTVFFLQQAGCPLHADFILHHYGPYSRDVARICDEMTSEGLLVEDVDSHSGAVQFNYKLGETTKELLASSVKAVPSRADELRPFEELALQLLDTDLWALELGSTILFNYARKPDWTEAIERACTFKKTKPDLQNNKSAIELAQRVAKWRELAA